MIKQINLADLASLSGLSDYEKSLPLTHRKWEYLYPIHQIMDRVGHENFLDIGAVVVDTGSTDRTVEIVNDIRTEFSYFLPLVSVDIGPHCDMQMARNAGLRSVKAMGWHDEEIWYMEIAGDEAYNTTISKLRDYLSSAPKEVKFVWPTNRTLKPPQVAASQQEYFDDELVRPRLYRYLPPMMWTGRLGGEVLHYRLKDGGLMQYNFSPLFGLEQDLEMIDRMPRFKKTSELYSLVVNDNLFIRDVVYEHYTWVRWGERACERNKMYESSRRG